MFAAPATRICPRAPSNLPRRDILDTFGCMLGGSGSPGIDELFAVISRWGGLAESRVMLRGIRLPAPQAALLNASMGHALDFDDTLDTGGSIHPGVSVLGSVLAVCDSLEGVTGRDVLLAVALGLDTSCRIALASTLDRGWHRTAAIGIFGATAQQPSFKTYAEGILKNAKTLAKELQSQGFKLVTNGTDNHIPVPQGMQWVEELAPFDFEYKWPNKKEKPNDQGSLTIPYSPGWRGKISLQGKEYTVRIGQGTGTMPGNDKKLDVFLNGENLCVFSKTLDEQGWASVIKPDGKKNLGVDETPPALYRRAKIGSYRDVTGMAGSGVPHATAVIVAKDDMRSVAHHAAARWLGRNHLPVEPKA